MKLLVKLLVLTGLSGLTGAAIVGHRGADLGSVRGTGPAEASAQANDIADMLTQAGIKRSAPVEIAEADLNRFLAATLSGRQAGRTRRLIDFEKAVVNLEPGDANVILCWNLEGHQTTTSLHLRVTQEKGEHRFEVTHGAYGRMPVARGFMAAVMPAYTALMAAMNPEIRQVLGMTKIHFAKDKLVLDPRF